MVSAYLAGTLQAKQMSPEDRLKVAYELCRVYFATPIAPARDNPPYALPECNEIEKQWMASPAKLQSEIAAKGMIDQQTQRQRALIDEVARKK
jgi:hypothetical protein